MFTDESEKIKLIFWRNQEKPLYNCAFLVYENLSKMRNGNGT